MLRRQVLQSLCVVSLLLMNGISALSAPPSEIERLAREFRTPPDSARPWAYWWWLDSNVTREGITLDLEEMKRQGIRGVLIFDAGLGNGAPTGPAFMGAEWRGLVTYAVQEADRLGIEVGLNICSGWDCGGTWVEPQDACKKLVWSETRTQGSVRFSEVLATPHTVDEYYRDIAVVAFPKRSPGSAGSMVAALANPTASSTHPAYDILYAIDGVPETRWVSGGRRSGEGPTAERPESILLEFREPFAATSLFVAPYDECGPHECELQTSEDGKTFKTIRRFSLDKDRSGTIAFDETRARYFRLLIASSYTYGSTQATRNVQISEIAESIPFLVDFRRLLLSSFQATFALCCNPSASLSASRSNGKWR